MILPRRQDPDDFEPLADFPPSSFIVALSRALFGGNGNSHRFQMALLRSSNTTTASQLTDEDLLRLARSILSPWKDILIFRLGFNQQLVLEEGNFSSEDNNHMEQPCYRLLRNNDGSSYIPLVPRNLAVVQDDDDPPVPDYQNTKICLCLESFVEAAHSFDTRSKFQRAVQSIIRHYGGELVVKFRVTLTERSRINDMLNGKRRPLPNRGVLESQCWAELKPYIENPSKAHSNAIAFQARNTVNNNNNNNNNSRRQRFVKNFFFFQQK